MNIVRRGTPFNLHPYHSAALLLHPISTQTFNLNPSQPLSSPPAAPLDSLLMHLTSNPTLQRFHQIYAHLLTAGLFRSTFTANHLLKSSTFLSSHLTLLLFSQIHSPNVFSYNIAIKSMSQTSHPLKSLPFYTNLLISGLLPNEYTFCFLLDCCSVSPAGDEGRQIHAQIFKHRFNLTMYSSTSLLHMYGSCGSHRDAHQVFDEMPRRSDVSWGAMINAFVTNRELRQGLEFFFMLLRLGFRPTNATLVSILCECADQGELEIGRIVHGYIVVNGLDLNLTLGTSLIDIYSNCGAIATAIEVFDAMQVKNVLSWNCLIRGLAINGFGEKALQIFEGMKRELEIRPNGVTYLVVLQACTHTGMIADGIRYFTEMSEEYGITPNLKHYGCVVDLYGKAGRVRDAMEVVRTMPLKPDDVIWVALFSAFRSHGYEELEEVVSANIVKVCAGDSCGLLVLSEAYARCRRWDDVVEIRRTMRGTGNKKVAGFSSIGSTASLRTGGEG